MALGETRAGSTARYAIIGVARCDRMRFLARNASRGPKKSLVSSCFKLRPVLLGLGGRAAAAADLP